MGIRIVRKPLFLIFIVIAAAIILVSTLAWVALRPISEKNGFDRNISAPALQILNVVNRPEDVIGIAGSTVSNVYFKTNNPAKVYSVNNQLLNGAYTILNIPNNKTIASLYSCVVDSPHIYIPAGNAHVIIKVRPGDSAFVYKLPESVFTQAILISDNSFVVRMFEGLDPIFSKVNLLTGTLVKGESVFEKKRDAGFGTDGQISYDKNSNLLVYVQYYSNEVVFLDTNVNLVRKTKTVGKNTVSLPEAGPGGSSGTITSTTPSRVMNISTCVSDGSLYVYSMLKADNETIEHFKHNSAIDVYDMWTGTYKGNFYIPKYNGKKIHGFKVIGDLVVALYRNSIVLYKLPVKI